MPLTPDGRSGPLSGVLSNGNLRRAGAAYGLSTISSMAWLSLFLVLTFQAVGPLGPGLFILVRSAVGAVSAPAAAAWADRWRKEHVLAVAFALRVLVALGTVLVLHAGLPPGVLYIMAAIEAVGTSAPTGIHYALLPWLATTPEQLVVANALSSTLDVIGVVVGGGMVGVLLRAGSPDTVLLTIAASCAAGALLIGRIKGIDTSLHSPPEVGRWASGLLTGVRYLRRAPGPRDVVLALAVPVLLTGVAQSFASDLATTYLGLKPAAIPILVACVGAGGFVGGVFSLRLATADRLVPALATGLALTAIGPLVVAIEPSLGVTVAVLVIFGAGIAVQTVATHSLLQRVVPTTKLGSVVGLTGFLGFTALGAGAMVAVGLDAWLGIRQTLVVTGVLSIVITVLTLIRIPRVEAGEPRSDRRRNVIDAAPLFRVLSVAARSQLARDLVPLDVESGQDVLVQGQPGDDFFIIGSGTFQVLTDGRPVATMEGGDSFGEIALLSDAPRTATVRAASAGRVWRLHRDDFLAALTRNPECHSEARAIAAQRQLGSDGPPPPVG